MGQHEKSVQANERTEAPAYARLRGIGEGILRYGLVFLLVLWGSFKFAAFEAEGIKPLVEHSPFMGWLYSLFSVRAASAVIGVVEVTTGLVIASRRWFPRASGYASLVASGIFMVTLSFLASTPGALEPTSDIGGFLMKDIMLLGSAVFCAGEALMAAGERTHDTSGLQGARA
jgi:uncharacterized membrane protein YkgB